MNKAKALFFPAGIMLALAFTFSCSGDDGDGNGGTPDVSSSSVDDNGGGSSSSLGGDTPGGGSNCSANFKTTTIGTQTWMAENLNCDVEGSKCYEDDPANCEKYGRLYDWSTALTACPSGWHLPSDEEWTALTDFVGGSSTAGTKLKATSGWNDGGNGTDEFGFSALPGGYGSDGSFYFVGDSGCWWSATERDRVTAYSRLMGYNYGGSVGRGDSSKYILFSVRCVQDTQD